MFIMCKEDYDLDKQLAVIQKACEYAGIKAEKSGRNDLLADGRKFSGNAFYQDKVHAYHHGTLMVDVDKDKLGRYLSPPKAKLEAKGVEVLYDDRGEKAGFVFSDADLIGIPLRIVVSPKTLAEEQVEFKRRGSRDAARLSVNEAAEFVAKEVKTELSKYQI